MSYCHGDLFFNGTKIKYKWSSMLNYVVFNVNLYFFFRQTFDFYIKVFGSNKMVKVWKNDPKSLSDKESCTKTGESDESSIFPTDLVESYWKEHRYQRKAMTRRFHLTQKRRLVANLWKMIELLLELLSLKEK